tara:strand:- start:926 stop:2917 length:1992 start_codon:yes stop_codon:yes gene_type:complete
MNPEDLQSPFHHTIEFEAQRLDNITIYLLPSSERELKDFSWNDKEIYSNLKKDATKYDDGAYNEIILQRIPELHKIDNNLPLVYPLRLGYLRKTKGQNKMYNDILEKLKNAENKSKFCIIGNGGGGIAGLIAYIATLPESKDSIIAWSADNSFPNFKYRNCLHCAITYEPHVEQMLTDNDQFYTPPKIILNNPMALCIPPNGDYLKIRQKLNEMESYRSKNKISNGRRALGLAFFARFFEDLKIAQDHLESNITKKWHGCYASRYNHSAIGESDKTMFILGAHEYYTYVIQNDKTRDDFFKLLIISSSERDNVPLILDRMLDLWESTCVLRKPDWFPASIMQYSFLNNKYLMNDTAFLQSHVPALKLKQDQGIVALKFTAKEENGTLTITYDDKSQVKINPYLKPINPLFNIKEFEDAQNFSNKWHETVAISPGYIFKVGSKYYKNTSIELQDENIIIDHLVSNYGDFWSPKNAEEQGKAKGVQRTFDFKKTSVFRLVNDKEKWITYLRRFNSFKCKNLSCDVYTGPFSLGNIKEVSFRDVLKEYLSELGEAMILLNKYYIIEWTFNNYEDTGDLFAIIEKKEGVNKVGTCDQDKYKQCWRYELLQKFDNNTEKVENVSEQCMFYYLDRTALVKKCMASKKEIDIKCNAKSKIIANQLCAHIK